MGGEWQFTDFYDLKLYQDDKDVDNKRREQEVPKEKPSLKQFTDITILLDRSGSMSSIKESMEAAFDKFIMEHRAVLSTRVTLVQFDDTNDQEVVFQNVPVGAVERLNLKPRGNTPLVDAFTKAIDRTGERFSNLSESDRPDQVLFVVITDGQENASKLYKRVDVSNRVNKQRDGFNWQFVYLGANQDAIKEAATYGIAHQWAMAYSAGAAGVNNMSNSLAGNTVAYTASVGDARSKSLRNFDDKQRELAKETD